MNKRWLRIALLNFCLAATLGAMLRFMFVAEIPGLEFRNIQHAHSHVAILGWVYLALYALLVGTFLKDKPHLKKYSILFWVTEVSVIGMLIGFSLQGYALWSIIFSSTHIFLSYLFSFFLIRDIKWNLKSSLSKLFLICAIFFMVLSTIGIWVLAWSISAGLKGSAIYYTSVQFFLHFQFNGWFLFAIFALLFKYFEENNFEIPKQARTVFFPLLLAATFLTFALAVAWTNPGRAIFWTNSLGVLIQLAALISLVFILRTVFKARQLDSGKWTIGLFKIALVSYVIKIIVQSLVALPYVAVMAYTVRNYVIGFIHLTLLAVVSMFIIGYAILKQGYRIDSSLAKIGLTIFILGIFLSEFILFGQGTMLWAEMGFIPAYYEVLFGASALLPVGLVLFLVGVFRQDSP